MEKVSILKLKRGDDIVGFVVESQDRYGVSTYLIKKPMQCVVQHTNQGVQVGLVPFLMFADKDGWCEVERSEVLCVYEPSKDFEKSYLSQVSGLDLTSPMPPGLLLERR